MACVSDQLTDRIPLLATLPILEQGKRKGDEDLLPQFHRPLEWREIM
jgi:hypothetical protein